MHQRPPRRTASPAWMNSVSLQQYPVVPPFAPSSDRSYHSSRQTRQEQPNLLFVGNLSYFCEISHLFDLFDQYGHVNGVRIVRNDNRSRTLMFGFVTMSTVHEANEMERILNGTFFMGRRLRVAISGRQHENSYDHLETSEGFPVHVGFISHFVEDQIIRPTEAWLRKVFTQYGVILDCSVKDYQWNKDTNRQEGYGFVSFASNEDAINVVNICRHWNVKGIILTCSRSRFHSYNNVNHIGNQSSENSLPDEGDTNNPNLRSNSAPPIVVHNHYHVHDNGSGVPLGVPFVCSAIGGNYYPASSEVHYPAPNIVLPSPSIFSYGPVTGVSPPMGFANPLPNNPMYSMHRNWDVMETSHSDPSIHDNEN